MMLTNPAEIYEAVEHSVVEVRPRFEPAFYVVRFTPVLLPPGAPRPLDVISIHKGPDVLEAVTQGRTTSPQTREELRNLYRARTDAQLAFFALFYGHVKKGPTIKPEVVIPQQDTAIYLGALAAGLSEEETLETGKMTPYRLRNIHGRLLHVLQAKNKNHIVTRGVENSLLGVSLS